MCDGHNDCQHREDEETAMCKRKFYILDELFVVVGKSAVQYLLGFRKVLL